MTAKHLTIAALLILGANSRAQEPDAEPAPEPAPEPPPEKAVVFGSSFELPPVTHRKSRGEGADIAKFAPGEHWLTFRDKDDPDGGRLILGLTNETSRTGRQSLFVQFDKLTKPLVSTELASDFISIQPGKSYRVAIHGRIDKKNPVALDQRLPYLKLRVDWFMADQEEQTGDLVLKVQPIPGSKNRPPLFNAKRWTPYFANIKSPPDAAFMRVTWMWDTPPQEGETNGVIFFDDATVEGPPGPVEDPFADDPEMKEEPETPEETPPAPPAPVAPPVKPAPTPPAGTKPPMPVPVPVR